MKYQIEIATVINGVGRPGLEDMGSDDNWEVIAAGKTLRQVLDELLEAANNEDFMIANQWLRLKIDGKPVDC